jgi:hypothetical protein
MEVSGGVSTSARARLAHPATSSVASTLSVSAIPPRSLRLSCLVDRRSQAKGVQGNPILRAGNRPPSRRTREAVSARHTAIPRMIPAVFSDALRSMAFPFRLSLAAIAAF